MYWFLDEHRQVLYVGKAKNLKNRVRSYTHFHQLSNRIKQLVKSAKKLEFQELGSELEALLTEAELIRRYQPQFNVLLKDDKSPLYILITEEKYPRILQVRKKELTGQTKNLQVFGPFQSSAKVREVLKIARKIFPWCNQAGDTDTLKLKRDGEKLRPCFYYHLDLCPGACVGQIFTENYRQNILQLATFLKGKKNLLTAGIKTSLSEAVALEHFEEAAIYRDRLALIDEVTKPTTSLAPELTTPGLTAKIEEDGRIYLQDLLSTHLGLPKKLPLSRIEGYDVSNTMGTNPSVAMVAFVDGVSEPSQYRLFNIRSINTPNDYQMMREAILRRQNHREWGIPDLLVIDGGKGQLRSALSVWSWTTPVISLVKDPDRILIPLLNWKNKKEGEYFELNQLEYRELKLGDNHPALKLLQRIRNEAHRFSKKQHSRRRLKGLFQ